MVILLITEKAEDSSEPRLMTAEGGEQKGRDGQKNGKMGGNKSKRKSRNVDKDRKERGKVIGNMEQTEICSSDKDARLRELRGGENFILMRALKSPC